MRTSPKKATRRFELQKDLLSLLMCPPPRAARFRCRKGNRLNKQLSIIQEVMFFEIVCMGCRLNKNQAQ